MELASRVSVFALLVAVLCSLIRPNTAMPYCPPEDGEVPGVITFYAPEQFPMNADYDEWHDRFLVTSALLGNIGVVTPEGEFSVWLDDPTYAGNRTEGIFVDNLRSSVSILIHDLSAVSPIPGQYSALAVYNLTSTERLLYTRLDTVGPQDTPLGAFPNDLTVETGTGTIFVTDSFRSLIWKVDGLSGEASVFTADPLFTSGASTCEGSVLTLNGIVYHPRGYLLVNNNLSGKLFKVRLYPALQIQEVAGGAVLCPDGMRFLPDGRLIVVTTTEAILLESTDDWESATILESIAQVEEQEATGVAIRNGRAYVNYAFVTFEGVGQNIFYLNHTAADFAAQNC